MKCLLESNLVRWIGSGVPVAVRSFQGKPDMLRNLPMRFAGYAAANARQAERVKILVLLDRDLDDCVGLKKSIEDMARHAGLVTRSEGEPNVLVRVAVRELENWYFGDWAAVRAAFTSLRGDAPGRYRGNPDADQVKTSQAFGDVLRAARIPTQAKPEWARRIGPKMDPDRNTSHSFRVFLAGAKELVGR